jgi:hypothetical protein
MSKHQCRMLHAHQQVRTMMQLQWRQLVAPVLVLAAVYTPV